MRKLSGLLAGLVVSTTLFIFLGPARAQAQDEIAPIHSVTHTVHGEDDATRTDIVFLSEGYGPEEQARFLADARAMVEKLETSPAADPMRHARTFNYHFVFLAKWELVRASSGVSDNGTPLKAHVMEERVLIDDALAERAARTYAPRVDCFVTLVKFRPRVAEGVRATARIPRWDGETFKVGSIAIPASDAEDFLHELGHALWALGDEYAEADEALDPARRSAIAERPNLTSDPTGVRWGWATDGKAVRPIEGAGCLKRGVFRSERDCLMRDLAAPGFCGVCRRIVGGAFDRTPADPISLELSQDVLKGTTLLAGIPITARWRVGGAQPVSYKIVLIKSAAVTEEVVSRELEGHKTTIELDALKPGRYELRVQARNIAPHRGDWVRIGFTVSGSTQNP